MRIGFDAKRLYNNFTGLGNYSRFVVSALLESYPQEEYRLFTPGVKHNSDTKFFIDHQKVRTILPPSWVSNLKLGSYWRSFLVGKEIEKEGVQLYHGLSHELPNRIPGKVKTVVTIHDLIFFRYPQFYNPIDVAIYKAKVRHACNTADRIIAISEQTAADVVDYLKISRDKIDVVYQGCHPNFTRKFSAEEIEAIRSKYNLPKDYILNVGSIESRKNAASIVKAESLLPSDLQLPIVLVGKKTSYLQKVLKIAADLGIQKNLVILHHVDFKDLPAIYQAARVFVYPSLFEGFGIPLIEAIESHTPVISSRDSCFSEAAGPSSIYTDPHHPEELAFQLEKVLSDENLAAQMVEGSIKYIEKFRPPVIAKAIHDVYERLLRD